MATAKFLVVEDDRFVMNALARLLRGYGEVCPAPSASLGRDLVGGSQKWDAIFIDIALPDGSGLDVLAHAREGGCDSPALVLTAKSDPDNINRAFDLGARYLVKPFDPERITSFVRDIAKVREGDLLGTAEGWAKRYGLTPAEKSILEALTDGVTHKELLEERGIRPATLRKHIQHMLKKTGDPSILAATARLLRERVGA